MPVLHARDRPYRLRNKRRAAFQTRKPKPAAADSPCVNTEFIGNIRIRKRSKANCWQLRYTIAI